MRSIINLFFIFFIFMILISATGCYYDKAEILYGNGGATSCTSISAKFSSDVKIIIQNKCATSGCHDAADAAGGTVLETYTQIAAKAARINQRCIIDMTMPPGGPLLPAEIAVLKCWISSGAPNN